MIVVDASALVDLLLRREGWHAIAARLEDEDVHAPELVDVEVPSALRGLLLRGEITAARAAETIDDLLAIPMRRHSHGPLIRAVWSQRAVLSAYDAAYVALAALLGAPLLTVDLRLRRAAGAIIAVVEP